jgi:predicted NUDIX family NTP pyrophosphohydrolase
MVTSAGLLAYRRRSAGVEVLLVHPGGPYWAAKDEGAWSVPKGLVEPHESQLACARREFQEETGFALQASGCEVDLGTFLQPSGKRLHIWALEADFDPDHLQSNLFELEWPPRSGLRVHLREVDRGGWFDRNQALRKITRGQRPALEKLYHTLNQAI